MRVPVPTRARLVPALFAAALLPACAAGSPVPGVPGETPRPEAGDAAGADRPVLDLGSVDPRITDPAEAEPRGRVPEGGDPVVAEVGGVPIRASEVARFLFRHDPLRAQECLNQILDSRMIEEDAAARGISVPREEVLARVEAEVRTREQETRVQYGPGFTLDAWLRDRFGFTLESYRADLAVLMRLQGLKDRLVRYEAAREDRVRFRVLVLPTMEAARDAERRLRDGADFTALARQVSLVPPEELPSFRREEIDSPALADELFSMAPGGISRPVRVARDGKEIFEVFKVVDVARARDLPWADMAGEIERGIRSRPVGVPEYLQWARGARRRHGVKAFLEEPAAETPK